MKKNHTKSLSQPERNFWREAFLRCWPAKCDKDGNPISVDAELDAREAFARGAVERYRRTITWRNEP